MRQLHQLVVIRRHVLAEQSQSNHLADASHNGLARLGHHPLVRLCLAKLVVDRLGDALARQGKKRGQGRADVGQQDAHVEARLAHHAHARQMAQEPKRVRFPAVEHVESQLVELRDDGRREDDLVCVAAGEAIGAPLSLFCFCLHCQPLLFLAPP